MIPTLRDYQDTAVLDTRAAFAAGKQAVCLVLPTGGGKCLAEGTPVLMYDGTIKPVEQIQVGDLLIGPDSKPRTVLSTCTGKEQMYRVTPTKGDTYTVNESHILSLVITGSDRVTCAGRTYLPGQIANVGILDYMAANKTFKHCAKGYRAPVDFEPNVFDLPIDPYFFGMWLGDGSSRQASITTGDKEVVEYLFAYAEKVNCTIRTEYNSPNSNNYYFLDFNHSGRGGSKFTNALKELGVWMNKHIPISYKRSSEAERLQLLAGIIDSDGHYTKKGYDICLKSEKLLDDVIFIARSLGFSAYKARAIKTCANNGVTGNYFRCNISGNCDRIPCKIARKKAAPRQQKKNVLRTGIYVEAIGEGNYYGFEIDGDHLFLLGDFTVTHNTVIFAYIAWTASLRSKKILILVHRKELLRQTAQKLRDFGVNPGMISPQYRANYNAAIQVAMVQTMVGRGHLYPHFDLVITDECFVPDTLITLASGEKRMIKKIVPGDIVMSYNEQTGQFEPKPVVRTFKNEKTGLLYRIWCGGKEITCTGNHPIFTNAGWVTAEEIQSGDKILRHGVCNLRKANTRNKANVFRQMQEGCIFAYNEPNQSRTRITQDENQKSDAKSRDSFEDGHDIKSHRARTKNKRRQRKGHDCAAKAAIRYNPSGFKTYRGIYCANSDGQALGLSESLQNRHCPAKGKNCNRNRRLFTLQPLKASTRLQKVRFSKFDWVDSVEILQPGCIRECIALWGANFVYNFEVADNHTYIAGGIIVHNCHHVAASTYLKSIARYPNAYQLGVTATPIRTDGKGLGINSGGIYEHMVVGPQTADLIRAGYLVEPVIHVPPSLVDLTGVRKLGGEYNAKEATERVDKRSITGNAMDHYLSAARYEPAVVFCASVAHAEHVAAEWRQMGIRAVSVDGSQRGRDMAHDGSDIVDRALRGLADGSVHAVMSCDLISEGTDIPAISYMADLGPTASLGRHIQKIGRTLRPAPGKDRAIIMDHVGNVGQIVGGEFVPNHGLPTDEREWTLDGEMISKRAKKEKPAPSVCMCGNCYGVFLASLRVCPYCGTMREVKVRQIDQQEGELVQLSAEVIRKQKVEARMEVGRAKTLEELEKIAAARGYKKSWAHIMYNLRQKNHETKD